ncbi:MAG: hypothetical protein H7039_14535, partial [Bryobacteraceae bacterium]|nr:hypothetical protein [Bryobacteraceae bacterium]
MSLPSAAFALVTALVFTLPWEKSLQWSGIGTISRIVGILAVMTGALSAARERRIRAPNLALVLAGLFVLWSGVTFFWSYDPQASIVKVATLIQLFCMSWLIWHLCRSEP